MKNLLQYISKIAIISGLAVLATTTFAAGNQKCTSMIYYSGVWNSTSNHTADFTNLSSVAVRTNRTNTNLNPVKAYATDYVNLQAMAIGSCTGWNLLVSGNRKVGEGNYSTYLRYCKTSATSLDIRHKADWDTHPTNKEQNHGTLRRPSSCNQVVVPTSSTALSGGSIAVAQAYAPTPAPVYVAPTTPVYVAPTPVAAPAPTKELIIKTSPASSIEENTATFKALVKGQNNVDVWFAFKKGNNSPSCTRYSDRLEVRGGVNDGETFSKRVYNLDDDTVYYYRACGEDKYENIISGNKSSFRTDKDNTQAVTAASNNTNTNNNNSGYAVTAATISAKPSYTVATLNGRVENGEGMTRCYFEYGEGENLNNRSSAYIFDSAKTDTCSRVIRGLNPGTKYFYRSVIENGGVVKKGSIKSFTQKVANKKNQAYTATSNRAETSTRSTVTTRNTRSTTSFVNRSSAEALEINKQVSQNKRSGYTDSIYAKAGDRVFYKVTVVNNTDKVMKNIVVTDTIPSGLELSGGSNYNQNDKFITSKIAALQSGRSKVFVTEMTVSKNVDDGEGINSSADVTIGSKTKTTNSVNINIDNDSEVVAATDSSQSASIMGSNADFLPGTLFGWLGLIAFIMFIVFLVSKVMETGRSSKLALAELRVLEAAKMAR